MRFVCEIIQVILLGHNVSVQTFYHPVGADTDTHAGAPMSNVFLRLFNDAAANVRGKIVGIYLVLIAANVAAWAWAFVSFHNYPALLGTGFLAYSFGLRHAVDADHIAAIDNVTRKLMQEGKRPVAVGFFFSLGHSTVVVPASIAVAATAGPTAMSSRGITPTSTAR